MDSTAFKHERHYYQQQNQHTNSSSSSNNIKNNNNKNIISSHQNNNPNSIFILNTATHDNLPNNNRLHYSDLHDNNDVSSSTSSSVWSSASSTMCSPAAHALQKLFNCSSNSLKFNHGNFSGIESKSFKSKSEILKKKTKFWKYLEAEANEKNTQQGIDGADATVTATVTATASASEKKILAKSFKHKSKYWSKSYEKDNQEDLSELLEYSCSLCDNCRCMDCQIGYFDCENSDDSNSQCSLNLSAYDDECDEYADESDFENMSDRRSVALKWNENKKDATRKLCNMAHCAKDRCCQQCFIETIEDGDEGGSVEMKTQQDFLHLIPHDH